MTSQAPLGARHSRHQGWRCAALFLVLCLQQGINIKSAEQHLRVVGTVPPRVVLVGKSTIIARRASITTRMSRLALH